jgi:hypothetical protein
MEHLPGSASDINMTTGTIFNGNSFGQFDEYGPSYPQAIAFGDTTLSGTVSDTSSGSVLAFLRFDTTGFTSGTWPVALDNSALGGTDVTKFTLSGAGNPMPTLAAGSITIQAIPEPATLALAVLGGIPVLAWSARRRNRNLSRRLD